MILHQRRSLCLVHPELGTAVQHGDEASNHQNRSLYNNSESLALDQLVELKAKLRNSVHDDFFANLCQGLAQISQSQYCFIVKKIFSGSQQDGAEIPALNEPASCITATHFYYDNGSGICRKGSNVSLSPCDCPCSYIKRGQSVPIPANKSQLVPNNPNAEVLAFTCEALLSVPLFVRDECVGHLCSMWTPEGVSKGNLSWTFLQLLLHSLEDLLTQKLIDGARSWPSAKATGNRSISAGPTRSDTGSAELERFAKKISHELRTPLQGIMGLSDLMHATLHDAAALARSSKAKSVFQNLKYDVEAVQSSSRRAVDAADNVVQAYELNMLVPRAPSGTISKKQENPPPSTFRGKKRKYTEPSYFDRPICKPKVVEAQHGMGYFNIPPTVLSAPCESLPPQSDETSNTARHTSNKRKSSLCTPPFVQPTTPGIQLTNVRDCIRDLVLDTAKRDDRLILIRSSDTEQGQVLEVHTTATNGEVRLKNVVWDVDSSVPEFILVEQRDMVKSITSVLHNALKFTDKGRIALRVKHYPQRGSIKITVKDTGPGISPAFRDEIFRPFSQEDDSITRRKEGLGLGLSVARGLARRLGGELSLVSAELSGSNRGCEFALRIPISETARTGPRSERSHSPSTIQNHRDDLESLKDGPSASGFAELSESQIAAEHLFVDSALPTSSTEYTNPIFSPAPPWSPEQTSGPVSPFSDPDDTGLADRRPGIRRSVSYGDQPSTVPQPTSDEFPLHSPNHIGKRGSNASAKGRLEHSFAANHPLNFLVAEDNAVNRKLLVKMLAKLGYDARTQIREACDGLDAVRQVRASALELLPWRRCSSAPPLRASVDDEATVSDAEDSQFPASAAPPIDVILMDLWMPNMDGYEATEKILQICKGKMDSHAASGRHTPVILAVTADATQASLERAAQVGMSGLMLKPFGMKQLERIVRDGWARRKRAAASSWEAPQWTEEPVEDAKRCHVT